MKKETVTFKGGIHPANDGKALSSGKCIIEAPLLEKYMVLLEENAGKAPVPTVKKGDKVVKYQLIARADGFISADLHAPTSGEVTGIMEVPGPFGTPAAAIEITADGKDHGEPPFEPIPDFDQTEPAILLQRIKDAGIVGMGGAAFPTHVKLAVPPEKKVDTLIINGAECEPYLTADHRLMAEHPAKVTAGAAILGRILQVKNIYIGIEANKRDAFEALKESAAQYDISLQMLEVRYPQGAEKQLIKAITGRSVPSGKLPMDVGCIVVNSASAAACCDAVTLGIPLIERIVTVTGEVVKEPGNFLLRIGTPVMEAVKLAKGVTEEPGKLILGGPMMGFAQRSFDVPAAKNTSGILLLPQSAALNFESTSCIRCGRCVTACPMNLVPCTLCMAVEGGRFDLTEKNHVMDCVECGACAYVCPAHRPLVQQFRRAKAEIRRTKAKKK